MTDGSGTTTCGEEFRVFAEREIRLAALLLILRIYRGQTALDFFRNSLELHAEIQLAGVVLIVTLPATRGFLRIACECRASDFDIQKRLRFSSATKIVRNHGPPSSTVPKLTRYPSLKTRSINGLI